MLILYVYTDIFQNDRARAVEGERRNERGEFVPADMCPKRIWLEADEDRSIPDMFFAQGQCIVSARVAEILSQFDLSNGALYPVAEGVFQSDNTTPIAGAYFSWIFGGMKRAFRETHSPTARPNSGGRRNWCRPSRPTSGWPGGATGAMGAITPIESGYYTQKLVRVDGQWLIESLQVRHNLPFAF